MDRDLGSRTQGVRAAYERYSRVSGAGRTNRRAVPYQPPSHARNRIGGTVRLSILPTADAGDPARLTIGLLRQLHGLSGLIILEIRVSMPHTSVSVLCAFDQVTVVESLIRGAGAGHWEIVADELPRVPPRGLHGRIARPSSPDALPLQSLDDARCFALAGLLEATAPATDSDLSVISLRIQRAQPDRIRAAFELVSKAPPWSLEQLIGRLFGIKAPSYDALTRMLKDKPREPLFDPKWQEVLTSRLSERLFALTGIVSLSGAQRSIQHRAQALQTAISQLTDAGFGGLAIDWQSNLLSSPTAADPPSGSVLATASELATLWSVPPSSFSFPGLRTLRLPQVSVPSSLTSQGIRVGTHFQRGKDVDVFLPFSTIQSGHVPILGETGGGKSVLLNNIHGQLAAHSARPSIVIVDPHGTLAIDSILYSLPEYREDDMILIEPANTDPVFVKPLFGETENAKHPMPSGIRQQTIYGVLKAIITDQYYTLRQADVLWNLCATVLAIPNASIVHIARLVFDTPFRKKVLRTITDPFLLQWWNEFEQLTDSRKQDMTQPLIYRTRQLLRSPAIRNIIAPSAGTVDLQSINESKLIYINLAGQAIKEEANMLGELFLADIHATIMARLSDTRIKHYPQCYVLVDESHRYGLGNLPIMCKEGRKAGLTLFLATQNLSSWSSQLQDAVLSNKSALFAFTCGIADARFLAPLLHPFTFEQLTRDLPRHTAILKTEAIPSFDIQTLPLQGAPDHARLERIRERSRQLYTRPRSQVEAEISALLGQPSQQRGKKTEYLFAD